MFLGLSIYAWVTIVTILAVFVILSVTKLPTDFVFLGGMAVLYISGTLSLEETFAGFASSTVITIAVLFIVISGLVYTGVLHFVVRNVMGTPKSYPRAIVRLMLPVAGLSAFMSNTAIVALFVRIVKMWARKLKIAPSKLLIPLSYASGMGGICTLIGTPPNMIISGMLAKDAGVQLGFFSTTLPGLFCLAVGVLSMLAMRRLLPDREPQQDALDRSDEFTVELRVSPDSKIVGMTVEESGLNHYTDVNLLKIIHFDGSVQEGDSLASADILGNDRLVFVGDFDTILKIRSTHRLVCSPDNVFVGSKPAAGRAFKTAYLRPSGALNNKVISDTPIEKDHSFVLMAVSRGGVAIAESPRETVLQAGDRLLIEVDRDTDISALEPMMHFYDSSDIPTVGAKPLISSVIMVAMILLATFDVMPLLQSAILAAAAMLITRCCSFKQARQGIDWPILMIFAASITFGAAIQKTGIAELLADGLLKVCGSSPLVILIALCFLGTFVTEFISNTACAAIFYPIAYSAAVAVGANPVTFCIALMISVSSSFATPIGSPTHMLVYGPGGYRFTDFIKVGLPMNLIILAANIFIVTLLFPL